MPKHSIRHKVFIGINIFLILSTFFLYFLGGAVVSFLGLFVLGVIQIISAIAGAIRGNRAKGIYLISAIVFVLVYSGGLAGYLPLPSWMTDSYYGLAIAIFAPLIMASAYTAILILTPSNTIENLPKPSEELLDDGLF